MLGQKNNRFFRTCRILFFKRKTDNKSNSNGNATGADNSDNDNDGVIQLAKEQALFYGATLAKKMDDDVSHVVCNEKNPSQIAEVKRHNLRRLDRGVKLFRLVTIAWILKSVEQRNLLLAEAGFQPK